MHFTDWIGYEKCNFQHNILHPVGEYRNGMTEDDIFHIKGIIISMKNRMLRPVISLNYVTEIDSLGVGLLIEPLLDDEPIVIVPPHCDLISAIKDKLGERVSNIQFYNILETFLWSCK